MLKKVILKLSHPERVEKAQLQALEAELACCGIELQCPADNARHSVMEEAALYITDCPETVCGKSCVVLYLTEENRGGSWGKIPYAVESLEGLDADFLEKVYRRHIGMPWEILHTERLLVREMTEQDLETIYEIYDQPGIAEVMDGLDEDRETERRLLRSYISNVYPFYGFGLWMLVEKESGRSIGRAGLQLREGEKYPELGFIIEKKSQRKGYCLEACRAILEYGFQVLELEKIQALVARKNTASGALCRKLGGKMAGEATVSGRRCCRFLWDAAGNFF